MARRPLNARATVRTRSGQQKPVNLPAEARCGAKSPVIPIVPIGEPIVIPYVDGADLHAVPHRPRLDVAVAALVGPRPRDIA